ncbi:uncharacterized protein EAE97_002205 [Botrytis byssoidea]|uniref:RING-type domain-containing protein n=1 Tax=Botrytis byssoidea TaxID=139641 RepID=A0A9P5ITD8_9HELO|nr:uncharacterized protein EAE97_002205 [Botrytis byssoidea]KAF7950653.1 hypothetical protein EAE97_002205 [Botrytis byssoidea]
MSSRENYISATEELERTEQQNTSGNAWSPVAVSLALHPQHQVTVRVDEIPQVTASQDRFSEDTNSQELAENVDFVEILEGEGPSGNHTEAGSQPNDQALTLQENNLQDEIHSDTTSSGDSESSNPAENEELLDVPQDAAVEDIQAHNAGILTAFEQFLQIRFPESLSNNRNVVEAIRLYTQQLNDRNGSGTTPASTIEINEGVPVATVSVETMESFYDYYATLSPRQSYAYIEKNSRNQAIDELLIPVLIDETQTEWVQCPICNENYDSNAENGASHSACMVPGCKHVFGRECINIWLKQEKKNTCPMCRAKLDIPTDSEDDDDD